MFLQEFTGTVPDVSPRNLEPKCVQLLVMSKPNSELSQTLQSFNAQLPVLENTVRAFSPLTPPHDDNDTVGDEDGSITPTVLHWFRRGLRFHDNPALAESVRERQNFRCIYIIDPTTVNSDSDVEVNKWRLVM